MAYNFDQIPNRRGPSLLNKWTWYPNDVLPLWVADMDFPAAGPILNGLQQMLNRGVLGYELPTKRFYSIIAARMKKLYGWEIDPDWFVYVAGVNNGYNIAARVLCSSKKGYLIQTPVYNEFHDAAQHAGVRKYMAPLVKKVAGNRIRYEVDFEAFERGVKKSGMFLLCHPHNPVGRIFSREELTQMANICLTHQVTVVSDEIHSELLLGKNTFTPTASLSPEVADNTITLISASKAFNVPGLACAFALIPNAKLREAFTRAAVSMSFEISTPGLAAAQIAYSGRADGWLRALRKYLTTNRDFILEYVVRHLPGVLATEPEATYLMWLDCSALNLKPSPYEFFLKEAKVALSDGAKFGMGSEQFVRLNFGTTRRMVETALKRMKRSLSRV